MGATKKSFLELRAEEMATMYDATFTKKEAQLSGKELVQKMLESGKVDKHEFTASVARMAEVLNTAIAELREHLPFEKKTVMGVEFNPVDGGYVLNYEEDEIYCALKKDVEDRIELLKIAQKQDVIDGYGNTVPKIGKTPRKSSLQFKW